MLSIERVKALIEDPNLSDTDAEEIRDACRSLAEIVFENWIFDREKVSKENENENCTDDNSTRDC